MLNWVLQATLTKPSDRESGSHAKQRLRLCISDCFARDTWQSEGEQVVGVLPVQLQNFEQLHSVKELE
jgi:hypothetical protein